jgi:excisionase family DNA binding protein
MSRLTVREAAEYVGLSQHTLNQMRNEGRGPRFLKLGGAVRYDTKDLDAWIDASRRRSTSDKPQLRRRRRRSRNALDMIG